MTDIKYCPNCQKELSCSEHICPECGFEFIVQEKKKETNAIVKGEQFDPVPSWLWFIISFVLPPVGGILLLTFRKKWIMRTDSCKDGAVMGLICWAIALIFILIFCVIKEGQI